MKPEDEKGKQALIQIHFDVNALRLWLFFMVLWLSCAVVLDGNNHVSISTLTMSKKDLKKKKTFPYSLFLHTFVNLVHFADCIDIYMIK